MAMAESMERAKANAPIPPKTASEKFLKMPACRAKESKGFISLGQSALCDVATIQPLLWSSVNACMPKAPNMEREANPIRINRPKYFMCG